MADTYFAPRVSADTAAFWQGCKEHRLLLQRCCDCGHLRWPAAYLCPDCLSERAEQVEVGPEATIYSFVVFHKPFHPSLKEKLPYVVATIDIGGARLVSNIVGCDPSEIHCGDRVRLAWSDAEDHTRPVFELLR